MRTLYRRLRDDGVEPWLDEEEILPGQDWEYEIARAVRAVDVVIVCLSRESVTKSGYIQKEIRFALDIADEQPEGTIFIIPLKLEECDVPGRLRRWHWVNYFEPQGYERLLRTLRSPSVKFEQEARPPARGRSQPPQSGGFATRRPMPTKAVLSGLGLIALLALTVWGIASLRRATRPGDAGQEGRTESGEVPRAGPAPGSVGTAPTEAAQLSERGAWVNALTLTGHEDGVSAVAFSFDGKMLASGSYDKTIKLWDTQTGTLRKTLDRIGWEIRSLSFSGTILVSGSNHFSIKLWDAQTGTLKMTRNGHLGSVLGLGFSLDGGVLASASCDETVKVWAFGGDSLTLKRTINAQRRNVCLTGVAVSPDGTMVASTGGEVKLWDVESGRLLHTMTGHREGVPDAAFSPNGETLASTGCDKTIKLWDVSTGRLRQTLAGHDDCTMSVEFSPDGLRLVSASKDKTIKLWDARTGALLQTLAGHEGEVLDVTFSTDGKMLASASADRTVRLWGVEP